MTARHGPGTRLAVSLGCPSGIGPEIAVRARLPRGARRLLVGDAGVVAAAARLGGIDVARLVRVQAPEQAWGLPADRLAVWQPGTPLGARDLLPGRPSRRGGAAQLAWVDAACDLVESGAADALVTGPVNKEAIAVSGAPGSAGFAGHTEHLQARLGAREVVMTFWTRRLTTALVTTHLALSDVPGAVTAAAVASSVFWLGDFLARLRTDRGVRLAVAALNPHAGEGGLLGTDERRRITPGIERARQRLARAGIAALVEGPVPAESAFRLASAGRYDGVVAMYHDQATIPMKLVGFGECVNLSLGLPIVRTSVDHGTAYDLAGKGTADVSAMEEALALAVRLTASARGLPSPSRRRAPGTRAARPG